MNRIFIFEFVSGGGFNKIDIPSSLFCEGYGMLRSIITDFKKMNFEVTTLLDARISYLSNYLNVDTVKYVNEQEDYITNFKKMLIDCESIFIIAPEFSNILYDLTKIAQDHKKRILSIDLKGIQLGASKIKTYEYFKNNHIETPETYQIPASNGLDINFIVKKLNTIKAPIVLKPDDGVGAESIYYFEDQSQIHNFFKEARNQFDVNRKYVLQKYIEGEDLSASLIGYQQNTKDLPLSPVLLSINFQDIKIKNTKSDSEYLGGYTPIENYSLVHKLLLKILDKLDLSMFNSYFGIDFIRNKNDLTLIEINPRLTTSYIGIRNIINRNPAEIIIKNFSKSPEMYHLKISKHSIFRRLELKYTGEFSLKKIIETHIPKIVKKIPEIITPPISFNISNQSIHTDFSCFIATKEKDIHNSKKRLSKIIDILHKEFNFTLIK